ncbi:response regulator [Paenibacillus sp. HWE-109]|uniref:response regulator n=1 Tax=Paenibacillus sp. HWE-109 TaxID=1306526 RepID=UPI001EDFE941|nr:response regulator [Paenibacillus sp. HWE-109]UKS29302.1 response regulator [Paenibacillus sp. HWE-109]
MYKILVVDDEPTVSSGIKNYLMRSELQIDHVETAINGFEALDCLRMDIYDLVLTDIQMGMMNGIELMEAILLEQPHLPVIVISAHEKFEFAKRSLRLGAKDYLIKPVELDELIRVVGKALIEKKEIGRQTLQRPESTSAMDNRLLKKRHEALIELVTEKDLQEKDYADLLREIGGPLKEEGYWYGIAAVHLNLSKGGFSNQDITLVDRKLLKYASVNILEESLSDWCGVAFYGFGNQLVCVIQLNVSEPLDTRMSMNSQLNLIGQTIIMNLKQYLNVDVTVGVSTLSPEITTLPRLMEEANAAIEWRKLHPNNKVLYYEDMSALGNLRMMEWAALVETVVLQLKTDTDAHLPDELYHVVKVLSSLKKSDGLFHSCFGLLVYRLYGLLFDNGQEASSSFRHYDPDVYYRGMDSSQKVDCLKSYVQGLSSLIRESISKRDQTVVSRISAYIHQHFGNHELKIQDIAGEVHFSAAYVSYLFKKETNKNVWDYVSEVRIEEAKHLLATTDLKRYEISYQVGYQSPEHFSRMFKRFLGSSPADYRKEIRGNSSEAPV